MQKAIMILKKQLHKAIHKGYDFMAYLSGKYFYSSIPHHMHKHVSWFKCRHINKQ